MARDIGDVGACEALFDDKAKARETFLDGS